MVARPIFSLCWLDTVASVESYNTHALARKSAELTVISGFEMRLPLVTDLIIRACCCYGKISFR